MSHKNIIIGAGPAGLTAAYELQKLGKKSIVLEADNQVGGISKTVNYQGNRFDLGGHRFFSKVPYVNEIWEDILRDDFLSRSRMSRIHYKNHFFDYPLKPINALQGLGLKEAMSVVLSYGRAKFIGYNNRQERNFEEWIINRFGYKLYEIFFKTYTEKVWGMSCDQISADWASQRIKNFSLIDALKDAFNVKGSEHAGEIITTLIDEFKYPRLGPGMMWERCVKLLETNENPTILNTRVSRIRHKNNQIISATAMDDSGNKTDYSAHHYISSMPLKELIQCLDPIPPDKVMDAANQLRYRDFLTVVLLINKKEVFPDNWIYIHTPEVKIGRIQNYKNWSPDMVENADQTTLGLEYFLWEQDEQWQWSDERLIDLGIKECCAIGLIDKKDVVDGTVVKVKKAYPVYDHFYQSNLNIIKNYLSGFKNLQTIGRNGLHRYNNQDHSMMTGVYAARNTIQNEFDVWSVNTENDYHEEISENKTSYGDRKAPVINR
jgi:protoporphyrinogen oxidase